MFLYNGHMDARFEHLCYSICCSLAQIVSALKLHDVCLFRHMRGLVHLCNTPLSEAHCGDSTSFVHTHFLAYCCCCRDEDLLPLPLLLEWHGANIFYAIREMMDLACCACVVGSIGAEQEQADLVEHLEAIDAWMLKRWTKTTRSPPEEQEGIRVLRNRIPCV